jgi:hypothetical protein
MLVADKTGVVGFIRAKSFFFPDSAARAVAGLPEILAPSGHHPAPDRVLPRQTPPDLHARIRRPPSQHTKRSGRTLPRLRLGKRAGLVR